MANLKYLVSCIDTIRNELQSTLEQSPRDFIRHPAGFARADCLLFIDYLTRPVELANDLRFVYQTDEFALALFAERLSWDSQFFGYDVARLNGVFPLAAYDFQRDYTPAIQQLLSHAQSRGIKYLFASVYPEDLATIRALENAHFQLIETRVVYHRSLTDFDYPERFATRLAQAEDIPSLLHTVKTAINPFDRFHSDPFIARQDADRLMEKWVIASISEGFADAVIVPDVENPQALSTVKYHRDHWQQWGLNLGQLVLGAVTSAHPGWYAKLVSEVSYHLKGIGAEHCFIGTQITNRAAIHSFEKIGYRYGRSEHIFRIIL